MSHPPPSNPIISSSLGPPENIMWTAFYVAKIWTQISKKFSNTFIWGLYQEWAFLKHTTQERLVPLDSLGRWKVGLVHGGFMNWCLGLFMYHWIGIGTMVWDSLNKPWLTMGQRSSLLSHKPIILWEKNSCFSTPTTWRHRIPSLWRGNTPDTQHNDFTPGLTDVHRETLLPFLTNVDTTDKLALTLFTKIPASTQSKRQLVLINPWISNMKYPSSNLCLKFLYL